MKKTGKNLLRTIVIASSIVLASTATSFGSDGHGGSASAAKSAMQTPADAMKALITGNESFAGHHDADYFEAYQKGQIPAVTVISCSDSRVHTPLFGMDPNNNIFIIRNIGNQMKTAEGSVDYGVHHLPCRILLIMGHSSCGAIKASMGDYSKETAGIKSELDSLKPVINADKSSEPFDTRWGKNVERNVDYQVKYATKLYNDKIKAGEMAVVGAVYDFNNLHGKGRGTLVITNINGETNIKNIVDHPAMKELNKAIATKHVGSLAPGLE